MKLKKFKQSSGNNSTKSSASQSKDAKKQKMPEVSETAGNSTPEVPVQTDEVRQCVVIAWTQSVFLKVLFRNTLFLNYLNVHWIIIFFLDKRGEKPIYANTTWNRNAVSYYSMYSLFLKTITGRNMICWLFRLYHSVTVKDVFRKIFTLKSF